MISTRTVSDGTNVMVATVARCDTGDGPARSACIDITEPIADALPKDFGPDGVGPQWMERHRDVYRRQAEDIYQALAHALPGGTLDALLGVMALGQASILKVSHPAAGQ